MQIYVYICINMFGYTYKCKEICCKGLAHAVMEAGRTQGLVGELVKWRSRRGDDSSLKDDRFKSQEEPRFLFVSKGGTKSQHTSSNAGFAGRKNSLLFGGGLTFLFYAGLQLIG